MTTGPQSGEAAERGGAADMFGAPWVRLGVAGCLIVVMASKLFFLYSGDPVSRALTHGATIVFIIVAFRAFSLRERYLLAVSVILGLLVLAGDATALPIFQRGLDQAAFLTSFILLMGLLREAAATSPAIRDCGIYLTRQPPGRRYLALHMGSQLLSVLVNFGSVSLLGPLVQRGVREGREEDGPLDRVSLVKEQRQLVAVMRGFSWILVWAPTAVIQALLLNLFTGVDVLRLAGLGFGIAILMWLLGWLEDRVRWRKLRRAQAAARGGQARIVAVFPGVAFWRLALVCASLGALTFLFAYAGSVVMVYGLMLAAPVVLVGWVFLQNRELGSSAAAEATGDTMAEIAKGPIPNGAREACVGATSGFIGILAAALISPDALAGALNLEAVPGYVFMLSITLIMALAGQLALSPIMMAVFVGSTVAALPSAPVEPTLAALAVGAGASLSMGASPFTSGILLMSRATGYPGTTIAWRWNMGFSFAAFALLAAVFFVLTGGK